MNIEPLIEILSACAGKDAYLTAKSTGCCIVCKKPAGKFRTAMAEFEYQHSGLCQTCQDLYFSQIPNANENVARPTEK